MKMDVHKDREGHVKVNPSWLFQLGIVILLSMIGYFLDQSLAEIKSELEFSRIERHFQKNSDWILQVEPERFFAAFRVTRYFGGE